MCVCVRACVRAFVCAWWTGSPEEWLPENVGALLFLCGDDITVKVLMSKAINGRVLELAAVIVSLCVVCSRQAQPTSWVVVVLKRVLAAMDNGRDRQALLRAVVDTFRDNVNDLNEFYADDPSAFHVNVLLLAVLLFASNGSSRSVMWMGCKEPLGW